MACFSTTDQKIEMLVSKCTERYATAREAYRYLDETNNGFITALDMQVVFRRLLQFDLDVADAQDILDRFAGHRGAEFKATVLPPTLSQLPLSQRDAEGAAAA